MTSEKQQRHYKSVKEDQLSSIVIDAGLLAIFLLAAFITDIKRKAGIAQMMRELISVNPFSALLLFILLRMAYSAVKGVIYNKQKKVIMTQGKAIDGSIVDTEYIKVPSYSPGVTYNYCYTVRLTDGRYLKTEVYGENFAERDGINCCTVYDHNDRYYFTDFRQR